MSKIWFIFFMMITIFLGISSNSIYFTWIFMEISLMVFIPFMSLYQPNYNNLVCVKYFMIQSVSSIMLIFLILLNNFLKLNFYILIMLLITLMWKIGLPPFHGWIFSLSLDLSWMNLYIFSSIQKILPFFLMSKFFLMKFLFLSLISISLSAWWSVSMKNIKKLIIISSIFSNSWIMISMILFNKLWLLLFMNYLLILSYLFILILNSINDNYLYSMSIMSNFQKLMFMLIMLIMGGLPPFIIFFLKITVLFSIMLLLNYFISLYLMLLSIIMMYMYVQYMFYMLSFYSYMTFKSNNELLYKMMNVTFMINFMYFILVLCMIDKFKILNFNILMM